MKNLNFKVLLLGLAFAGVAQAADSRPVSIGPDATISFETGGAMLTPSSRTKLKELVAQARTKGKIDEIQVAVWSDNPVPRVGEQLSQSDRKLAEKRGNAIRKYLKTPLQIADVDSYNMAERASWLARVFDTNEAELKAEIGRGGNGQMSREEFQVFRDKGKPSNAVALVIMKH